MSRLKDGQTFCPRCLGENCHCQKCACGAIAVYQIIRWITPTEGEVMLFQCQECRNMTLDDDKAYWRTTIFATWPEA